MRIKLTSIATFLILGLILIIIAFTRFLFLDSLPPGMSNDEVEYALSSKTYTLNGADLSGAVFPRSLFATETLGSISPIVPILLSPVTAFFQLSLQVIRVPYVIMVFFTSIALGYLSYLLFNNKKIAAISAILFLINPWSIFLSRFTTEGVFALFFYLTGITFLIRFKKWKLVLPLSLFVLGFFSYHGAKLSLLPIVVSVILYKLTKEKRFSFKKSRPEQIFISTIIIFIAMFGITGIFLPESNISGRSSEIVFLNGELLSENINYFRRQSIDTPVNGLFLNKATESFRLISENYLSVFSPEVLFLKGDPGTIHAFYYHGLFYLLDIPLLMLGFLALWQKERKKLIFILSLIMIAPLSTAFSSIGKSIVLRTVLLLPLFIIISSYGIYNAYKYMGNRFYRTMFLTLISIIIFTSYVNFLFLSFARLPVLAQDNYGTSYRVLAKFINTKEFDKDRQTIVVSQEPRQAYLQTIFYSSNNTQKRILKDNTVSLSALDYKFDEILFTKACPTQISKSVTYIIRSEYKCDAFEKEKANYSIIDQKDAGPVYDIYNSTACRGIELKGWNNYHTFYDYQIDDMDSKTFCQRWISKR